MAKLAKPLILLLGAGLIALLWRLPVLLGWNDQAALDWLAALQLAGPTAAAVMGGLAAVRSTGRDRTAWSLISAGSLIYLLANIGYLVATKVGASTFPTPVDAAFFLMALLFAFAVICYGRGLSGSPRVEVYNLILLYGAMIIGTRFLLHYEIKDSTMGEFATLVAFLYPALWSSIAVLAAVVLTTHPQGPRALPLALLTVGIGLEATADFLYATHLMAGTYHFGDWPHLLWTMSAAFIVWSAAEHALIAPELCRAPEPEPPAAERLVGQAMAPAAILLVVLLTGSISGAFGRGIYQYFSATLAVLLTIVVGMREYWMARTRSSLEAVAAERLRRLVNSEARLKSVLESTSDGVLVMDADWNIQFYNGEALAIMPELATHGVGSKFWTLFVPDERATYAPSFEKVMATGEPITLETYNETRRKWFDLRIYSTGRGVSVFFRDISEERRIRDEIVHLAHHDFLTGLYNRVVFNRRLTESTGPTAVLLIDLDSFKEINDTLGHAVGDAVLVQVAERLGDCVPAGSLVARVGGDEFAVVVDQRHVAEVREIGERITRVLASPFRQSDQILRVGVSIGIATTTAVPAGLDLFTRADIALYEAKAMRTGNVVLFEPAMEVRIRQRSELLADLSEALAKGEFSLAFQPLLDTSTRRIAGFEALVRWRHPVRGEVSPGEFIPLAEESGLIADIGGWVLRTACAEAASWPDHLTVSVNLSTRQLADEAVVDVITAAIADAGLDRDRLELEVTESALLRESNMSVLRAIQDHGIKLALDDFGTGYSSLSYLQRFQFSKLKIDRAFIIDVPENAKSRAIVSTVVELARTLGMSITAEGVETKAQFDWVAACCDQVQGYYVSRPLSAADARALLARENEQARAPMEAAPI